MNKRLPTGISALRAFSAKAGPGTINLGLGKPEQDMPPALRDLAAGMIENPNFKMDYSDNGGLKLTRDLLEQHYHLPPGSSLLTHGAQEGLFASFLALLNPGEEVLLPNPGFLGYGPIVESLQAKAVYYSLDKKDFSYSLKEIEKKVTRKTKAILLNSPANPTGSVVEADFVRELAGRFPNIRILSDEVYGELHYSKPYIPFCRYAKNIISVNAFSKSHALTGWRIGWVSTQDVKVLNQILVAHQYIATCASVPAQHLVAALLSDEALFDLIRDRYVAEYLMRRDELFRALKELDGLQKPEAGFYAFLPIPKRFSSSLKFADYLLKKKNVLMIPGEFFGSLGKRRIRLSYAASLENIRNGAKAYLDCF